MNLEGTKHEKAVLIVIAYIIGFTSGFIAFGISGGFSTQVVEPVPTPAPFIPEGYSAPTENPPAAEESAMQASPSSEVASYEDGKLYASVKGERYVLSLHNDIMPVDNVEGFSTQGIHAHLPKYSSSADSKYVHFCEQQTEQDACTHFIFDTEGNVIQPVSLDGQKFVTTVADAMTATWDGDLLWIGEHISVSAEAPWKLTPVE